MNWEAAPSSAGQGKGLRAVGEAEGRSAMPKAVCPSSCPRQELDALQQVGEITRDWEESWNQWKTGCFLTLQTEAMESMAHGLFRRLTRLAKEYKVLGDRQDGPVPAEEVGRLQCNGTSDVSHLCSGPKLGNY